MYNLPLKDLDYIADRVVMLLEKRQNAPEPEFMSFKEIRDKKNISQDTLTRWIDQLRIKTHSYGRGKAIKRKDFIRLP